MQILNLSKIQKTAMRLLLIHGFGEDEQIFEPILQHLKFNFTQINVWRELELFKGSCNNVREFARELVGRYSIQKDDCIIGHSMGGWIGLFVKEIAQCRLIQISSWTNPAKVILPISNPALLYFLTKHGFYINKWTKKWLINKYYKDLPSRSIMEKTLDNLINKDKKLVVSQLKLILEPVSLPTVAPDLRIHTYRDPIIRRPDESYCEVPGDHFALYTYPVEVSTEIVKYLTTIA